MMASPDKRTLYLSSLHNGKTHDYQILKSEFPCAKNWFEHLLLRLDSGFQGFYKDYKCSDVKLPIKRKRVAKGINLDNIMQVLAGLWNLNAANQLKIN
jgi:hypothetical protein